MQPSDNARAERVFSFNVLLIEIQGDPLEFEQLIEKYIETRSLRGMRGNPEFGLIEYRLLGEDERAYGTIKVQQSGKDAVKIIVNHVNYSSDNDETNDGRLVRLRNEIPVIIQTITEKIDPDHIQSLINNLEGPTPLLTTKERAAIKDQQKKHQEQRRVQGFYSRLLLDAVFESTPELLMGSIIEYQLEKKFDGLPFWRSIELKGYVADRRNSTVGFYTDGQYPFGFRGQIDIVPTSDKTTGVKIMTASDVLFVGDTGEEAEYFRALDELTQLAAYLVERTPAFKIIVDPSGIVLDTTHPKNVVSMGQQPQPNFITESNTSRPGRIPKPGYDAAYKEKTARNLTIKQAYKWWKEQFPAEFEAFKTFQDPYTSFKAAMRLRKDRKR